MVITIEMKVMSKRWKRCVEKAKGIERVEKEELEVKASGMDPETGENRSLNRGNG